MMTEVFNAADTAPLAVEAILAAGSYDLGPKVGTARGPRRAGPTRRSSRGPSPWTRDKGAKGDFDD